MRLTEEMKENRRKEDEQTEKWKQACESAWDDKQFCSVYYNVKEKMSGMKELSIDCQIIVPGVTQKAVIKAVECDIDCDTVFALKMYKNTQMLFVIEYHQQKKWFLAKIACRDNWKGRTVWYLEAK